MRAFQRAVGRCETVQGHMVNGFVRSGAKSHKVWLSISRRVPYVSAEGY